MIPNWRRRSLSGSSWKLSWPPASGRRELTKAVGDAAEKGEFDLLTTLQDRATQKKEDIELRQTAGPAHPRSMKPRTIRPERGLRCGAGGISDEGFGRGTDSEQDRVQLNDLFRSHGIRIFIPVTPTAWSSR